uniref:CSON006250 protein n=1 Tax=Culicoides sonorensis TaxID=179676 RepID=A0A336LYT1_CULSO
MSFILSTIKNLAVSTGSTIIEETVAEEANEADSGGVTLPSPCGTVTKMGIPDAESDFNQWLHAMKMVARLPGGMPPDFRRKLWLALSDRYLQTKNVNWKKEEEKCFSETWGADDQELGVQIVKDLHRTGSSLCSGPAGTINQAKLKRILLGYARWNPEVGYCQGFNMLGALILQVMDKNESDAIKVMIFLIEGLIPSGYFHGSLGGLQADMAVFIELLGTKLPRLARHLQKLQGPQNERALEPPLTNVFTMQWFLTLFCNCLPINCVLRVWDLILIEGSDVLLRTALAIWSLLEEKILLAKTADDFYCKMGILSGELLNGTLIDSNGLVQKIVDFGPIKDLNRMRERHRQSIPSLKQKKGLKIFYSDDDLESDEESKMAVATAWGGLRNQSRRNSQPNVRAQNNVDTKERIALDINTLKKQYNKLRERQKQAHVILSSAVKSTNATQSTTSKSSGNQVNNLLAGKSAIISNKRRSGPPPGTVPLPRSINKQSKPIKVPPKSFKPDSSVTSLNWKDIKQDENISKKSDDTIVKKRHDSSSYSEDSDSSTSTSLCDDDPPGLSCSSVEGSPLKKDLFEVPVENRVENLDKRIADLTEDFEEEKERKMLEFESILDNSSIVGVNQKKHKNINNDNNDNSYKDIEYEQFKDDELDLELAGSYSPLEEFSPINEAPKFLSISPISPFRTPSPILDYSSFLKSLQTNTSSSSCSNLDSGTALAISNNPTIHGTNADTNAVNVNNNEFVVTDEGVINELFERINSADPRLKSPSTVIELPINVCSLPDASIIPACADMAAIPVDRSPLINKNMFNLDTKKIDVVVDTLAHETNNVDSTQKNSSLDDANKIETLRKNSTDLTVFIDENSKILTNLKSDNTSETSTIPRIDNKTDAKTSFVKSDISLSENKNLTKSPKPAKRVTFSEEKNKVEVFEKPLNHDLPVDKSDNEITYDDRPLPEVEKLDQDNRGNYFIDTIDEIVSEQAKRKLKLQITEIPESDDPESELIHEEIEIVQKIGKFNEMSSDDDLIRTMKRAQDKNLSPLEENKNMYYEKHSNVISRDTENDMYRKSEIKANTHDFTETSYEVPPSSFKRDNKIEHKKDLSSDISSEYARSPRKMVSSFHMSSFDEVTQEIRKEINHLKSDISTSKLGKTYSYDEDCNSKYKRPSSLGRSDDVSLEQLSTDTLRLLLSETKNELRKDFYGSSPDSVTIRNKSPNREQFDRSPSPCRPRSPFNDRSPIRDKSPSSERSSVTERTYRIRDELLFKKYDAGKLSPYEKSPSKRSRDASPVKTDYHKLENSEYFDRSAKIRELHDLLDSKEREKDKNICKLSSEIKDDNYMKYEEFKSPSKQKTFNEYLDVKEQASALSPTKLSPRAELHAILTKPSIKETMDFSYLQDIPDPPSNDQKRSIKLFSTNEELKTPNLRDSTNISDKISSITKTINNINNLCKGETKYELTYRTLERYCDKKNVHSVRKEMDENNREKIFDDIMIKSAAPTPIVKVSDTDDFHVKKEHNLSPRIDSRSRDTSPRKSNPLNPDDSYEARVSLYTSELRYARNNFDKLDRFMFKKESEFALAGLQTKNYKRPSDNLYTRSTSPPRTSSRMFNDDLDIRQTTVTSTLYDRYFYEIERAKFNKSPSASRFSRDYSDSLKPSGSNSSRVIRSAETSPSRIGTKYVSRPLSPSKASLMTEAKYAGLLRRADNAIKSCDNIPAQLRNASLNAYLDKNQQRSHQDLLSDSYRYQKAF